MDGLTPVQRQAASEGRNPVLIVAGPGTGKTRTLTHRIAWLVTENHAAPTEILAVTFTNRAAAEMRQRLESLLTAEVCRELRICTFHAFCLSLLRDHAEEAGLPPDFGVIDGEELIELVRTDRGIGRRRAAGLIEAWEAAAVVAASPEGVPAEGSIPALLSAHNALDLAQLVPRAVELLRRRSELAAQLEIRWVCVDEYQDLSPVQYELLRLLTPQGRGLCAIGDPDQAIYGFRGSDVRFFLDFQRDFPSAAVHCLKRNYRSDGNIVEAAARVIAPGRTPLSVTACSVFEGGERVRRHQAPSVAAEAEFIAHEIEKWLGGVGLFSMDSDRVESAASAGVGIGDVAVLARMHVLAEPLAAALDRLGLPVEFVRRSGGRGAEGLDRIVSALRALVADGHGGEPAIGPLDSVAAENPGLCKTQQWGIWHDAAGNQSMTTMGLLDHIALAQEADAYTGTAERIPVMTLHAAKGLEFPIVFIAGCEDDIIPLAGTDTLGVDPEEERRLLYVGMTRAQRVLYLTNASRRCLFGKSSAGKPSRFLEDIDAELLHRMVTDGPNRRHTDLGKQLTFGF